MPPHPGLRGFRTQRPTWLQSYRRMGYDPTAMRPNPSILMCPPDFYGIEYEINPWMSRSRASDDELAREQWKSLFDLLTSLGADIRLMPPSKGFPISSSRPMRR